MRTSYPRLLAVGLVALLLSAAAPAGAQTTSSTGETGTLVEFPLVPYNDTLFVGVDAAYRVVFDEAGDVWYSTEGGVVHVDKETDARRLYTHMDGLPSSYSLGIATQGDKVYVATDLGLAIIDRESGEVDAVTPLESELPDGTLQEVALVGDEIWMGTRFMGVAMWDPETDAWRFHNTSTTPTYAKGVRRIVPQPEAVWVATDGDGLWRHDRESGEWRALLQSDGLASNSVLSVVERGDLVYIGTDKGLQRWAPEAAGTADEWLLLDEDDGLPDERVLDLDVIESTTGSLDLWATTREGAWQLEVESGNHTRRGQNFGILGSYVMDNTWSEHGWAFATSRGVSVYRVGEGWSYYATGPSHGASNGPLSYRFTSASTGEMPGYLWFGSSHGVAAYRTPTVEKPGRWFNFGEWQEYPGSVVNFIDTEGNTTWLATNKGTYGYDREANAWVPRLAGDSRNLVYGLEADRGELWIGLFGDGLVMQNLTTQEVRRWGLDTTPALPDANILDVRAQEDAIWMGSGIGVIKLDRSTGNILATYTSAEGIPGNGVTYRVLPDGPTVWVGTRDGGLAKLDVTSGRVSRVWSHANTPGWPDAEIRSLHREGGRLWVGTTDGLVRLDVTTGEARFYNAAGGGLVQNFINGISSAEGILYLATFSGVARLDIAADKFLPMQDLNLDVGAGSGAADKASLSVRIETPRDGSAVAGSVTIQGSALHFGGSIDRVEVRIGEGPWQPAEGRESWRFTWDSTTAPADTPLLVQARAWSGEVSSREAEILLTPVAVPDVPLSLQPVMPSAATALLPLTVTVTVSGDEPLSAALVYKSEGTSGYQRLALARQGNVFSGIVPGKDMKEGDFVYYFEAKSGLLAATYPENPSHPARLPVGPAPSLAVDIRGPASVSALAGTEARLPLNVTNAGTEPASFRLTASGLRASWVELSDEPIALEPGESREVEAILRVPALALAAETSLTFEARDTGGLAEPARADVPVTIQAATATAGASDGDAPTQVKTPLPVAVALLATLGAALVLRRWRA